MIQLNEAIKINIQATLDNLGWRCENCPQVEICEDQSNGGESRYCWPMIEAAIMGHSRWETKHRKEIL